LEGKRAMDHEPQDLATARKAAMNARSLVRMAQEGRDAVRNPEPLDWTEGLGLCHAIDYLSGCVARMARELEWRRRKP
jgi:hypothetical protein